MSSLFKRIVYNKSTRIIFYFYLTIVALTLFFVISGYYNNIQLLEDQRTSRLKAISASIAISVDANLHDSLVENVQVKDGVKNVEDHPIYAVLNKQLNRFQKVNGIETTIYTLVYSKEKNCFQYVVRSDDEVYYMHEYVKYPEKLKTQMNAGGILERYQTENGEWISAFHPIKNRNGKTVALVEVDEDFDTFVDSANRQYRITLLTSFLGMFGVALLLFPFVRRILIRDEQVVKELRQQKKMIETTNREIASSVDYASTIQQAMLPEKDFLNSIFSGHFILFKPRDVVSGDFYWARKMGDFCYVAVADCTGHGVPGAMMSMMGATTLNALLNNYPGILPGELLDKLDQEVHMYLGNKSIDMARKDGMDIGIIRLNTQTLEVSFSGALSDLIVVKKEGEMSIIESNRFPIGGADLYLKTNFDTKQLQLAKGDRLYLYSDGFQDQFGGPKGKKYRKKQLLQLIEMQRTKPMEIQSSLFETEFENWKQGIEQIDDVLVTGFEL